MEGCRKKIPTEEPLFRLVAVDLVKSDEPVYHISRYLPVVRKSSAPFSFVLSFTLPYARRILGLVLIFEADEAYGGVGQHRGTSSDEDSEDESQLSPSDLCLARCASSASISPFVEPFDALWNPNPLLYRVKAHVNFR